MTEEQDDVRAALRYLDAQVEPATACRRPELFHRHGCAETVDCLTGGENVTALRPPTTDEQE